MELRKDVIEIMEEGCHYYLDDAIKHMQANKEGRAKQDVDMSVRVMKKMKAIVSEHAEYIIRRMALTVVK